jgi:hypothetical protein
LDDERPAPEPKKIRRVCDNESEEDDEDDDDGSDKKPEAKEPGSVIELLDDSSSSDDSDRQRLGRDRSSAVGSKSVSESDTTKESQPASAKVGPG